MLQDFLIASIPTHATAAISELIRCCFGGDDESCALRVFEEGSSQVKVGHGVNGCVFYLMGIRSGSLM